MMNRMIDLAKEAGIKVEFWMTNPPKPFQCLLGITELEKFAELIVLECADVASAGTSANLDEYDRGRNLAAELIKEHFGVR